MKHTRHLFVGTVVFLLTASGTAVVFATDALVAEPPMMLAMICGRHIDPVTGNWVKDEPPFPDGCACTGEYMMWRRGVGSVKQCQNYCAFVPNGRGVLGCSPYPLGEPPECVVSLRPEGCLCYNGMVGGGRCNSTRLNPYVGGSSLVCDGYRCRMRTYAAVPKPECSKGYTFQLTEFSGMCRKGGSGDTGNGTNNSGTTDTTGDDDSSPSTAGDSLKAAQQAYTQAKSSLTEAKAARDEVKTQRDEAKAVRSDALSAYSASKTPELKQVRDEAKSLYATKQKAYNDAKVVVADVKKTYDAAKTDLAKAKQSVQRQ